MQTYTTSTSSQACECGYKENPSQPDENSVYSAVVLTLSKTQYTLHTNRIRIFSYRTKMEGTLNHIVRCMPDAFKQTSCRFEHTELCYCCV